MRYALLMHYREPGEGELSEEVIAEARQAFADYGRALAQAGVLLSADVLQPTAATTTVTRREGGLRVQDGPFAETKEALAGTGPQARQLPSEALHLAEVLTTLVPGDPEAHGLAALVQLSAARAGARIDAQGRFVPLGEQDPALWDSRLIGRAHGHLRAAHARGRLGRFQVEAAIQAVHCARARTGTTDWPTLLSLHQLLHTLAPSLGGGVALAAVTAEVDGPAAGLALLDALTADAGEPARRFQPARVARAHLLERLVRGEEAAAAYDGAIALTHDHAEREYLRLRRPR